MRGATRLDRLALAATLASVLLAVLLALAPSGLVSRLHGGLLYPALSRLAAALTGWTDLPLGMAVLPLGSILLVVWQLLLRRRSPLPVRLVRVLLLAALLASSYWWLWGVNYRKPELGTMLGLQRTAAGAPEMNDLALDLLAWVVDGAAEPRDESAALDAVAAELEALAGELGHPVTVPRRVKTLPAGTLMSSGYAGMLFPFTLEAQVDGALGAAARISVGAHELAHSAGIAKEADADLAALLAGLRAADPFARYATALSLLNRLLPRLEPDVRRSIEERLPPLALRDLQETREASRRYLRPSLAGRVTAVYDRLLRGQGVSGGVASYGLLPRQAVWARQAGLLPEPPQLPAAGG